MNTKKLNKNDFEEILKNYNIGKFKKNKHLENVLENEVHILLTTKGKFILKQLNEINLKEFENQIKFIDFLYSKKIPVTKNIKNKKSKNISLHNGKNLIIQRFIEGKHPEKFDNSLIEDIAKNIGKMHKALLNSKFNKNKNHNYTKRTLGVGIDKNTINKIQGTVLNNLKKINFQKLKATKIHGDLSEINMIVKHNKLKSFIDFDDSDYDYLVYEIAIFIAHCFVRSDIIYKEKIKLFLKNYQKYIKLNDEEKRATYYLIKYRLLGILCWHFKYIEKYPDKEKTLMKGINRSFDRIINFEKIKLEDFLKLLK
jgi:Ser/Thr protein kinase RdoA (MazF antagonist)